MPPPSGRKPVPPQRAGKPAGATPENSTVLFDTRKEGKGDGKGGPSGSGGGAGRAGASNRPESTVLFDSRKMERIGSRARLIGVSGRRRGQEFSLNGTEVTIGREPTNDVVIADISVSRQHARMRRGPEGWLISDAGGGNGTRVNGLAIDEVLLHDGDMVEFGSTELQFVDPPEEPKVEEDLEGEGEAGAPKAKKPMPLVRKVAIGVGGFFLLAILLKVALPHRGPGGPIISIGGNVDQFALARKLILASKWTEAKAALEKAQQNDPDNPEVKHYLDTVIAEIVNQQHLDAATATFAKQDMVGTLRELKMVGSGSLLSDAAGALKLKVDAAVAGQVQKASDSLVANDLTSAKTLLDLALAAEPDQPQALALLPKLNGALAVARVNSAERDRLQKIHDAEIRLEKGPIGQARGLFRSGDVGGALAMLQTATGSDVALAGPLRSSINSFSKAYQEGRAALSSRRNDAAVREFGQARSLALQIGGSDGALAVSTGKTLAQLHDQMGMTARSARQMDKAYRHFAAAVEANSNDFQAHEQLHRLETEAEDLYHTAYGQISSDPTVAARNLKLVVEMTPPSSSYHQKAQERLSQLGPAGSAQ
jgi:pSer/pThr/pTyr-binding forkhead associated (FHA) protein